MHRKGFTLLELLIVIGILAVLATVAVLVINPAEYLKQSRDAKRVADLNAVSKAMSMAEFNALAMGGAPTNVYVSLVDTVNTCANLGLPPLPATYRYWCVTTAANLRKVDGTGWIPVTLSTMAGGSPLATLPIDPVNNNTNFYTYIPGGSFALSATLESEKYLKQSGVKDGGASPAKIEVGTDLQLLKNAEGLVGYWSFDEGSGTVARDTSGKGNNGAFVGAPAWVDGKLGKALSFDGVDDYVNTSVNVDNSQSFTVSAWVNTNSLAMTEWQKVIMSDRNTSNPSFDFYLNNSPPKYSFTVWNSVATGFSARAPLDAVVGEWAHIVGIYDAINNTVAIYVNGVIGNVVVASGTFNNTGGVARIGWGINALRYFDGEIDDMRIYERALTGEEIQSIYNATK